MVTPDDVTAVVGPYWDHRSVHTASSAIGEADSSRTLPSDLLPEENGSTSATNKVHLVVRPLGSERPIRSVTLNSRGDELESTLIEEGSTLIEEESQCSVMLYENGTGPLSASGSDVVSATSPPNVERVPSCEPNFKNCLAKSANSPIEPASDVAVPGYLQNDENLVASFAQDDFAVEPSRSIQPTDEGFACEDISAAAAQESSQDAESHTKPDLSHDGIAPPITESNTAFELETPSQAETNVERKVVAPKNKLPVAIQKPDNPRAIRYWLDQRRAARCPVEQPPVKQDDPVLQLEPEELDLFHVGRDQGVHDALGQRVLQVRIFYLPLESYKLNLLFSCLSFKVLNVIRNLSFDDVNSAVLAQSEACMRLLLLAAHARWSCLPQLAFDAISNVALEVKEFCAQSGICG